MNLRTIRRFVLPAAACGLGASWLACASIFGREVMGMPWWGGPALLLATPTVAAIALVVADEVHDALTGHRRSIARRSATHADGGDVVVLTGLDSGTAWTESTQRDAARLRHPSMRGRS